MDLDSMLLKYNITTLIYSDVREGWVPMIENLVQELIAAGWDKELHQVKEKFGALRFYIGNTTEELENIIVKYEKLSAETCEQCGQPGKIGRHGVVGRGGWLRCLCQKCADEYVKKIQGTS